MKDMIQLTEAKRTERLEAYYADRKAAEPILSYWRTRFPNNAYAWPGSPEEFAIAAVRAMRGENP